MAKNYIRLHTIKQGTQKKDAEQGRIVLIDEDDVSEVRERAVGCMICKKNGTDTIVFESVETVSAKLSGSIR